MKKRTRGSLKVFDEQLQPIFSLRLFTAHKLTGRAETMSVFSLRPSRRPSDMPTVCAHRRFLPFIFLDKSLRFILLFYYFHFLVFMRSFLRGVRFITMEESNNKT